MHVCEDARAKRERSAVGRILFCDEALCYAQLSVTLSLAI